MGEGSLNNRYDVSRFCRLGSPGSGCRQMPRVTSSWSVDGRLAVSSDGWDRKIIRPGCLLARALPPFVRVLARRPRDLLKALRPDAIPWGVSISTYDHEGQADMQSVAAAESHARCVEISEGLSASGSPARPFFPPRPTCPVLLLPFVGVPVLPATTRRPLSFSLMVQFLACPGAQRLPPGPRRESRTHSSFSPPPSPLFLLVPPETSPFSCPALPTVGSARSSPASPCNCSLAAAFPRKTTELRVARSPLPVETPPPRSSGSAGPASLALPSQAPVCAPGDLPPSEPVLDLSDQAAIRGVTEFEETSP